MNNLEKLNALYSASRKAIGFDADGHDQLRKIAEELFAVLKAADEARQNSTGEVSAPKAPSKAPKAKLAEVVPINS